MTRKTLSAFLLFLSPALFAQEPPKKEAPPKNRYTIARASSQIRVDGVLDEQAWKDATVIPIRYEWNPGDNVPAPVATDGLLAFDTKNLYIGFRASDPKPAEIRAHLTDRDIPFYDDTVGFFIDPFNDHRRAFQFRVNPLGVQMDSTFSDIDDSEDWSWDAIWSTAGKIDAGGYTVEIAIPFTSLRFPNAGGVQTWGIFLTRDYPRSTRHRMQSSYRDKSQNCVVCFVEDLTGLEGIRPGRDIELDPTITAHRTDERPGFPDGSLEAGSTEIEGGLTTRWGITPNITMNAAINPDFSQVEADAAQFAVNQRFALFFPEKRPFFLEGADFFSTPINAVFTRTVANPRWGMKLTGKQNKNAGGVFISQDEVNNLIFPSNQFSQLASLDEEVLSSVARYRLDVGETSTVGVLATSREGDGYHNRVGGVDGTLRLAASDTVRFQYLHSSTDYPDTLAATYDQPADSFSGNGLSLGYNHSTRDWYWNFNYRTLSPEFRADSGFVPRVDTKAMNGGIQRTLWARPGEKRWTRMNFGVFHDTTRDFSGRIKENGWDLIWEYYGPRQSLISINVAPNREHFQGVDYNNLRNNFYFEIRPTGDFAFFFGATKGKTIDFTNGQQADLLRLDPTIEFTVLRRIEAQLSHAFQRLDVDAGRLFDANLTQARIVYHLSLRTFVRAIVQYTDLRQNPAAYTVPVDRRSKELFSQLLFSYKVNPQTVLLAGYSDNALGVDHVDLTRTDRTFFLKIGYALLF